MDFIESLPGLIATSSPVHTWQHTQDINYLAGKRLYFGTACAVQANGSLGDVSLSSDFIGVTVRNNAQNPLDYFEPKELITVLNMGAIWVRLANGVIVKPFDQASFTNVDENGVVGLFTNADPDDITIFGVRGRFLKQSGNIAVLALSNW